jgi:acyl phosphate:glycerol-3-phosphate acyltransferase
MTTILVALMLVGYLLGSVPASYLAARSRGIDLRIQGTRQVGGGNLWRTTSRTLGLLVGFFDFFKGLLMVWVAYLVGLDTGWQLLVGLAVIVGHNWPVFLRFHGGRGIATLVGIVAILPIVNDISPWPSVIAVGSVVVITVIFRTSAVPVLFGAASLPLTSWLFGEEDSVALTYFAIFLIIVIKRLTAQKAREKRQTGIGQLLWNRLLYDRDIADRKAWVGRRHAAKKGPAA